MKKLKNFFTLLMYMLTKKWSKINCEAMAILVMYNPGFTNWLSILYDFSENTFQIK